MKLQALLHTQWADYAHAHRTRVNLLLHLVAVPLFLLGNLMLIAGLVSLSWSACVAGVAVTAGAFALQGIGHRGEPHPPVPFRSIGNATVRIMTEQWITFPRFVVAGGWLRALRATR